VGLPHFVGGVPVDSFAEKAKKVRIRGRVQAGWKKEREENILDIDHFEPID